MFNYQWAHSWLKYNIQGYNEFSYSVKENMADGIMNNLRANLNLKAIPLRNRVYPVFSRGWSIYYFGNWNPFKK